MSATVLPTPSGPLPTGRGFCIDCAVDVQLDRRGRCITCGCLGIPASTARRVTFLTRALWASERATEAGAEPPVNGRRAPRFNGVRRRPMTATGGLRWSVHYDACVSCGRTDAPPRSRGTCSRCYMKLRNAQAAAPRGA